MPIIVDEWEPAPPAPRHCPSGKKQLSEAEGAEYLSNYASTYSTLQEWEERARKIREGVRRGAGLWAWPKKTPLNAVVHSLRTYNGYTCENVYFEAFPGFFVTGALYRPLNGTTPYPGILCPHGHHALGHFSDYTQIRCSNLARMGAVVFSYDMIGYGESKQATHCIPEAMAIQLWDSIRAVDFLTSLLDVNPDNIGMTGESGGGSQTFFTSAFDDRIRVSIPVVQVSAHFYGGCNCESGMPIHKSMIHQTVNAEIAALAAPRAQLIISDGDDWTKNVPHVEYPYISNVYSLYGASDQIENFHDVDGVHNYNYKKRVEAYKFFVKHMGLVLITDESDCIVETGKLLHVFDDQHPLPASVLQGNAIVSEAWRNFRESTDN